MNNQFDIANFHYDLPERLIAQSPAEKRDASRLLVLEAGDGIVTDRMFSDVVDFFSPGDLLVVNDTRVFPARFFGKKESGGHVEFLALEYPVRPLNEDEGSGSSWNAVVLTGLMKSSKAPKPGTGIVFGADLAGEVLEVYPGGKVKMVLRFRGGIDAVLAEYGNMPLPPYIRRGQGDAPVDRERYQTVYATKNGAVAAPTAGLHFTHELLDRIRAKGVYKTSITLHVGYGTFAPVRVDDIRLHEIHQEYVEISDETATVINRTREAGKAVWTVGTTTARALEFAALPGGGIQPVTGWCDIYIYPGYRFKVVRNLITNFHLPRSSLLFMICALAGREKVMAAYEYAVKNNYRFYSYGDAMAIIA